MPVNKSAFLRYNIIDDCLRNTARPWPNLEALRLACEEKLFSSEGDRISPSTIEKDLNAMRHSPELGYHAPIAYNRTHRGYEYTDPEFTIKQFRLNDEHLGVLQFAARTLVQFKDFPIFERFEDIIGQISDRLTVAPDLRGEQAPADVQFESAPRTSGTVWLGPLLNHIREREQVQFDYLKFDSTSAKPYVLNPLMLKEYRNRWYLIGQVPETTEVRTFGLDRVVADSLIYTGRHFEYPEDFDPAEHFAHALGITVKPEVPEEVVCHVAPRMQQYLATTPIHSSQSLHPLPDGRFALRMRVHPCYELMQFILGAGKEVEVIAPASLRIAVKQALHDALSVYE